MRFDSPSRHVPEYSVSTILIERHLSWGFLPFSASGARVHGPRGLPRERFDRLPDRTRQRFPSRWLRRRPQVFPTSRRLFPLAPLHPFQMNGTLGFFPSGVSPLHEAPTTHRRRYPFLTLLPPSCASPRLGRGTQRAWPSLPRMKAKCHLYRLQGFVPRGEEPNAGTRISGKPTSIHPSWFSPPHG